MELLDNNMNNMNTHEIENFNSSGFNLHGIMPMSGDNFSNHHHHHPHGDLSHFNFIANQSDSVYDPINLFPTTVEAVGLQRDRMGTRVDERFMNLAPPAFAPGLILRENKGYGGKKRKKNNQSGVEKPREVVHVRAKRGEATDSHSLAERLRREKINEKLKRLQEQVPGCYKTMGMSVMLDVIINYVRSLQNQIEFLSMKLQAASMFYDFNSTDTDVIDTMKETNGHETQVMAERMVEEGYGDLPRF